VIKTKYYAIEVRYWVNRYAEKSSFAGYITIDNQWVAELTSKCLFADILLAYQVMNDYYYRLPTDSIKDYFLKVSPASVKGFNSNVVKDRAKEKKGQG
jgi:hypothetical protein